MKKVDLSVGTITRIGSIVLGFFDYLELLDSKAYHIRISNGGRHTLILYPDYFTGEDMDIILNMYLERFMYKELGLLFKKYITQGVHYLAKPLKVEREISLFEPNINKKN